VSLSAAESSVVSLIGKRTEEMYAVLERHVAIPTGRDFAPGLNEYRDLIRTRLEALGAAIELREAAPRPSWIDAEHGCDATKSCNADGAPRRAEPILVARHDGNIASRRILIAGHIDTVHDPHGPFQTLTRSPDGRTATGPGAVDMKGGIVCALFSLEALHQAGIDINWTFLLNADEEKGSFQSEHIIREESAKHDFGIALEPALADGSLAIERMGSGQFMIEVRGVAAHVGREFEKGRSAVTRLGEILVSLARMADPGRGRIVNVGPVAGGAATNIVPDYAACWGNVRYADAHAGEDLARMLDELTIESTDGISVTVHRHWNRPAKPLTPDVETFAHLARRAAEDLGQSLPFAKTGGVCDGNIMQDAGLPSLDTLGIRGGHLHRSDEFIEVASLAERAQLLAVLLMRLSPR